MSESRPYIVTTTTVNSAVIKYLGGKVLQENKPVDSSAVDTSIPTGPIYDPTTQTVDIERLDAVLRSGYDAPVTRENRTEHVSFNLIDAMKEQGTYPTE